MEALVYHVIWFWVTGYYFMPKQIQGSKWDKSSVEKKFITTKIALVKIIRRCHLLIKNMTCSRRPFGALLLSSSNLQTYIHQIHIFNLNSDVYKSSSSPQQQHQHTHPCILPAAHTHLAVAHSSNSTSTVPSYNRRETEKGRRSSPA
jgi:hypothetical protein